MKAHNFALISIMVCLAFVVFGCAVFASANGMTASVRLERYTLNDPVRIVRVLYGDTDVTPTDGFTREGAPFTAGDDWIKHITVVVKNTSQKTIVAGSIQVSFPETGKGVPGNPITVQPICVGREPEIALYTRTGRKRPPCGETPLTLGPGEEFVFAMEPHYDDIRFQIAHNPNAIISGHPVSPTTCLIQLGRFYFNDETAWAFNVFYKPGVQPGEWIAISKDEFLGPAAASSSKQAAPVLFERAMDAAQHKKFDIARMTLQTLIHTYPDSEYAPKAEAALKDLPPPL